MRQITNFILWRMQSCRSPRMRLAQVMRRHGLFSTSVLLLVGISIYILQNPLQHLVAQQRTPSCTVPQGAAVPTAPATAPMDGSDAPSAPRAVTVHSVPVCVYTMPTDGNTSLMYPAVDARGMVWFGKMGKNALMRLDPRTGVLREWTVPSGLGGIMDTIVDAEGAVWFSESAANFIGRFEPRTERFTAFPLPRIDSMNAEPVRLWDDARGGLWFTAHQGMRLGRLDLTTGAMRLWEVPRLAVVDTVAHPFSIAVTATGEVWFGAAERGGALGRLDLATGAVRLYPLAPCHGWPQDVIALAPDQAGRVWYIDHQYACMGYIETATGQVSEWQVPPAPSGEARVLNALVFDPTSGAIWMTSTGANALIRYQPGARTYTYYPLTIPKSIPYGLALTQEGALWFTADGGSSATYVGVLTP